MNKSHLGIALAGIMTAGGAQAADTLNTSDEYLLGNDIAITNSELKSNSQKFNTQFLDALEISEAQSKVLKYVEAMDEEFYKNFTKRIGSKHSFENRNSRTSLNFVEYKTLEIQKAYNKTLVAGKVALDEDGIPGRLTQVALKNFNQEFSTDTVVVEKKVEVVDAKTFSPASQKQINAFIFLKPDWAFNMRVLSLIHPELKNVENTKESMAEYADMIVDAITQFQTTYHGKEYTAEIDGIFGPASARAIKSKRDLGEHKEVFSEISKVSSNEIESSNRIVQKSNIKSTEKIPLSLQKPIFNVSHALDKKITQLVDESRTDINYDDEIQMGPEAALLRHNLESQTTALTAKFTNIAEVINDNPKYFEKNAIESLLVDTVLENFFENITSGNLDSYGSISTSRLQKDTLRSAFTSQGISGNQTEMLEYLLDDDIQKRVVDNKYGTPNSTNTDKSVIEKTGRFSSIKKFFGFGLDIKEAGKGDTVTLADSYLTEQQAVETNLEFIFAGNNYEDIKKLYPKAGYDHDNSGESQSITEKKKRKFRKEDKETSAALASLFGTDNISTTGKILAKNETYAAKAHSWYRDTVLGIAFERNKNIEKPDDYSISKITNVEQYADVHNYEETGVVTIEIDGFSNTPNAPLSERSRVSAEHLFQMLGRPGIQVNTYGDLEELCDELGISSVMNDVGGTQQNFEFQYTITASGEVVITTVTETTTNHYKYKLLKQKTGIVYSLKHSVKSTVDQDTVETFGVKLKHKTRNGKTTGSVRYGDFTELKNGILGISAGRGGDLEINTEGEIKAILSLVVGKIVSIEIDTNGDVLYTLSKGFSIGNHSLDLSLAAGSLNSVTDFAQSGKISASLNKKFTNKNANAMLENRINELVSDDQLKSQLLLKYSELTEKIGSEINPESWSRFYMNRIITKATNSLKATFSVNPKFSIDKNILEQMSFSVSDALSTAIGISTTINTYTPYNTAIEVPTKTKKIDSSIFTDGKTINYNTIYDTLAEKYNIPSERITVTIKNGKVTEDGTDYLEYSLPIDSDAYLSSTGMEIHQLPKRNAIISFEVIEAQETQFDTSVLTSKEKRALLDLTQSYNPLVTYTSGNNEFDRCENDINGDIIEKCDKSIGSNMFAYLYENAPKIMGKIMTQTDKNDGILGVLSAVRIISFEGMEKRNAHKMTEDRDVFKLATEKMHEGKQAAEVFKKYSGISEESYGKIIQSHMQLMREAKAGETTSYSSTNFSVMIITSENGTVEAHVIRPLEKIYGYGLVKDGENSLLALDKCQNFSPIHEIAEEKDVVEYLLQLESGIKESKVGISASITANMSPELLKTSTQEVSITSEKYSDWFTKEYTFSRSEGGAGFGGVSIMRPLNAEDAGEGSELQQAAQGDDPVRDSQRLWYGENTSVLDRANAGLNDQGVHSWSDLRNIATQSVQYEFDGVRDQLNQDIEEMTNGGVSAHDVNYVNPESSTTVNFVDENGGDIDLSANDENALRQQEGEDYHCDNCEDISHKINQAVSKALDIAEKNGDFDIDPFNIPFDTDVVEDDMEKIRTPERI